MVSKLTTFKFFAAVILAVAVIFGGYFAVSTVKAQAVTLNELVELFISLGIIPADKAAAARAALATTPTTPATGGSCATTFTRNLSTGATGAEVMALQKFLNGNGFTVAATGAGSAGNESSYFGPATKAAVVKFQNNFAADVLTPVGLTSGTGYWGASSRAKANAMCSSTGPVVTPTTGTLIVGSTTQPSQTLAPQGASRIPFTKFTLTNSSNAQVTVTGVTVQRTGLGVNAVFAGVTLVDSNNIQYGIAKTLNSNYQAVIGDTFTLNAGETKTFTVAGNMAADLSTYAGQVVGLSVVGINTTATISGSLPIVGAMHVINASLSIGSVSTSTSAFDPGTTQNKNIGDTAVRFSGLRFTASSAEDLRMYSIRFRQSGTVSSADLSNVMVYVDGTAYPTMVSSDGKYYTVVFPAGVLIEKGFTKDVYVQADITGSGAAGRTAEFDIDKGSDVFFVGQLFGYGIAVSGSYSPWFTGYLTTILAGTATSISKANEVAAQNVAVNVQGQVLGGFATEFKGEAVSVQSIKFTIATTSVGTVTDLPTNVSLVNESGVVVAGPSDFVGGTAAGSLTLADTVTFPTGRHIYTLKGKIPADWSNNGTFAISTTPNSTNWTTATGQTSGNTITLPNIAVTMNTMTVKSGAVTVSVSATPTSQFVVSGVTGFTASNVQFDATQSGEDIRFNAIRLPFTNTSLNGAGIVNCFAYDGATRLNDTAVSPGTVASTAYTFSFNTFLIVPKGTVKTVAIKCDVPASVTTGSFSWGMTVQPGTSSDTFSGTGVSSGQTIYPIAAAVAGSTMSAAGTGTLTVAADSSALGYRVVAAGTTGVQLGVLKFHATNEPINLTRVALQMSNVAATSSPSDLVQVTLWDGATQVGTALFTGTSRNATSTLTSMVTIPANGDKVITIKGDLAQIGTSLAGTEGALIQVDYDGNDSTGTQGLGTSSGSTASSASADTAFAGVRMFRSYPTVAHTSVSANTLATATGVTLDKFTVTTPSGLVNGGGAISLYKFTINVATSTGSAVSGTTTVTNLKVYAYTDSSYSSPVGGSFINGLVVANIGGLLSGGDNQAVLSSVLNIPAGTTYYFAVKGDTTLTAGTGTFSGSVTTKLGGDAAYPVAIASLMGQAADVDGDANDNFIWSPNATTTSSATANDWTNGYLISGLPTDYLDGSTISK